jgi:hypothetical protein
MNHARDDTEQAAPVSASGWREAAVDYHKARGDRVSVVSYTPDELARLRKLAADDISLERAWHELKAAHFRGRAARSTVEALMYSLRERGIKALTAPDTQRRISEQSEQQLHEIGGRLQRLARACTTEDIEQLVAAWVTCHA